MSSVVSVPAQGGANSYRTQSPAIDPDNAMDLYTLWNSVFASSRIDGERDHNLANASPQQSSSEDLSLQDEHNHAQPSSLARGPGADGSSGLVSAPQATVALSPAANVMRITASALAQLSTPGNAPALALADPAPAGAFETPPRAAGIVQPATSRAPAGLRPASVPDAAAAAASAPAETASVTEAMSVQETQPPELSGAMGADSVNVFVRGSTVAIVVRDAAIGDTEAVSCAFETAQKLTGQRAALRQLTLNGRVLYRQPVDAAVSGLPQALSLVFTC